MRLPAFEEWNGGLLGAILVAGHNKGRYKPLYTGLHKYAAAISVGVLIGHYLKLRKEEKVIEREVYIWDYVNRHPEDFPELKQPLYKDFLGTWTPNRK